MIDLRKKSDAVGISLAKKGINKAPTMRVGAALDISTSMENMIPAKLQHAFDQLMGVSIRFDDNGELDIFAFNHECRYVGTADERNHADYVERHLIAGGGTAFEPIVREARSFFLRRQGGFLGLGGKIDRTPVLMMVLTDGQISPDDEWATERAMRELENEPIYFHLVGVGGTRDNFPSIARLADRLDNVGEVYLPRFDMSDAEIYDQLIGDELVRFIKRFT